MTNLRRGFTMIELIFVIVIIAILAAVATSKLSATRDDAKISTLVANTRTFLNDVSTFYTSKGNKIWKDNVTGSYVGDVSNVALDIACETIAPDTTAIANGGKTFRLCSGAVECVKFVTTEDGNMTITATAGTDPVCMGVAGDPAMIGMAGTTSAGKVHQFGGVGVVR